MLAACLLLLLLRKGGAPPYTLKRGTKPRLLPKIKRALVLFGAFFFFFFFFDGVGRLQTKGLSPSLLIGNHLGGGLAGVCATRGKW